MIITDSRAPRHPSPPERPVTPSWSSGWSRTWSPTPSVTTFRAAGFDVATYAVAGRAIFTIANTGPRIPAGELTRLFQPFQRLSAHPRPPADGVGLGLAIVQAIANAHDATLTARPRTGGGLRIDVAFAALD